MNLNLIILVLSILILLVIFLKKKKPERYQPEIGEDVYKYMILPELNLEELNNFAITSKANLNTVNSYLSTFKTPKKLTLKALNTSNYFSQVDILKEDILRQKLKRRHPNKPDILIQSMVNNYYLKNKLVTEFSWRIVGELFEILESPWMMDFKVNATDENEEKNVSIISMDTLPVTKKTFDETHLQGINYAIKFLKYPQDEHLTIRIFIRQGTNSEIERELEGMIKEVNENIINQPLFGSDKITVLKSAIKNKSGKIFGHSYSFELNKILLLSPEEGFEMIKENIRKKKGGSDFIFDIEELEEKKE